ncbi:MAG: hypothetical protein E7235_06940 [Lachnospiraceae bacterium]|nr:hypothetical protein [Lachnospiraceae bacterium]
MKTTYEIMHGDRKVAWIDTQGHCKIYFKSFMPFNLYLEETDNDIDTLVNNITNFQYWCASRILTLDRQYVKVILNSIGASQSFTDKERANIALSYRCLSLTDIYWVRNKGEKISFADVNLYENHLNNAFVDVSLRGKHLSIHNSHLEKEFTKDLSTNGCYPKAWIRNVDHFQLYKDGGRQIVENEILASKICQCFDCNQIIYSLGEYDGEVVSVSNIMTSKEYSIVSREAFEIYAANKETDPLKYILKLDAYSYYMMNILDYLIGNTDRHWGNWGLLVDNKTNKPISLHPLMDFNQSFNAYDTLEGANCQTVMPSSMTQKEAAIEAVKKIGLNQMAKIEKSWFSGRELDYTMFINRLELLNNNC